MSVAGPSRARPSGRLALRENISSTYEDDLHGFLDQLTLEDMDEMQTFFAQRASVGERLSDHELAMNDLLHQARVLAAFNEDRMLAQQIADGEDVEEVPRVPVVPRATGNRTTNLGRTYGNQRAQAVSTTASGTWGRWLSSMVDWVLQVGQKPAESGITAANINLNTPANPSPATANNRPTGHDCVICQDPIRGSEIRAPCGHYYDIECITDLFQSATRDETLYPPRCCRQNIPFAHVQLHLSQALVTTFLQKQAEFGTLKRVYCSSPACSRFLGPLSEGVFSSKIYTCPAPGCGKQTCGKCRTQHSGDWTHVCRPDADAAQVLELSRASGWARCPGCSQMIELHIGCFHMTCRCRTEFCYLCNARWKTCQCPQWDERRLLAAAEERVDAQLGRGQDRGVRRDVEPARRVPPVPVRAPALPARPRAHVPVENAPANRARVVVPAPAPRPAAPTPTPTATRQPVAQQSRPATASVAPARTPTYTVASASTSTSRPTPAVPTRTSTNPFAAASTSTATRATSSASTSASTSKSGWASLVKPTSSVDTTRQQMVREMMKRLRVDHECDHVGRWHYRNGGGICQSCGHHLPKYLFDVTHWRVIGADGIVFEEPNPSEEICQSCLKRFKNLLECAIEHALGSLITQLQLARKQCKFGTLIPSSAPNSRELISDNGHKRHFMTYENLMDKEYR